MLLWSGARLGEVAQLRTDDLQVRDGVLAYRVSREAGNVKTDASVRWVPVASRIRGDVEKHLERRRAAGDDRLFPSLWRRKKTTPGDMFGKWLRLKREEVGLPPGPLEGSHKFRHTVRTRLAAFGVGVELADGLTGHAAHGSAGRRIYTHTLPLDGVLNAADALKWQWPPERQPRPASESAEHKHAPGGRL